MVALGVLVGAACTVNPPPTVITTPKYPDFPALTIPAALKPSAVTSQRYDEAWRRLQTGDLSGARRDYAALLQATPGFYPAAAGLGYVALASHDYKEAMSQFTAVLTVDGRYRPALDGRATAALGAGDDVAATSALEAILRVDPTNETARSRLDVVRFRMVQKQIDAGRRAREAGRLDDSQAALESALAAAPSTAVILRELALTELAKSSLTPAESHARKAVQSDPGDPDSLAVLGQVLDKAGKTREAADAYDKAFTLDPRPAWRDRRDALRARADDESLPKEFKAIASSPTVTRGDLAAMIGLRLGDVLAKSSRHVTVVATDARSHWASQWILQVTQAGLMDVFPNHTFQPAGGVRRADLADVVSRLLTMIATEKPIDLPRWKAARPQFSDLSTGATYASAALAVASGTMAADGDRFGASRPATGADLVTAMTRLQQIAR
jgi:tetratricopeptide (TPR) repeat protein